MQLSYFIYLIGLLFAAVAIAGTDSGCPSVRLDQNGGPFEKIPVYDQMRFSKTDSNICYAVSMALLADAHRFFGQGRALEQLTSPLSIALNFKTSNDPIAKISRDDDHQSLAQLLVGLGEIESAFAATQGKKVCDQRWLDNFAVMGGSSAARLVSGSGSNAGSIENFLRAALDEITAYEHQIAMFEDAQDLSTNRFDPEPCLASEFFRHRLSNGLANSGDILRAVQAAVSRDNPMSAAQSFLGAFCEDHGFVLALPRPEVESGTSRESKKNTERLFQILSELLRKGISEAERDMLRRENQVLSRAARKFEEEEAVAREDKAKALLRGPSPVPIAIKYDPGILRNEKSEYPSHYSVIIGSRTGSGAGGCEFLVRDSYGPNCNDVSGKPRYAFPCEAGNVWVPAKLLMQSTQQLTWLPRN